MAVLYYESQLCHHGIKGQKWGVRRFQDKNGRLTLAGKKRYGTFNQRMESRHKERMAKAVKAQLEKRKTSLAEDIAKFQTIDTEWKTAMQPVVKFHKNQQLYDQYLEKAAKQSAKDLGITDPDEIKLLINGYKYGDLNQGHITAFKVYCQDKHMDYKKITDRIYDAEREKDWLLHDMASDILESSHSLTLNAEYSKSPWEARWDVASIIEKELESNADPDRKYYYLEE